jgi:opacity protein-like surface antigen/outer membrane receptor protein involved in Fe transport
VQGTKTLDQRREVLLPKVGTNTHELTPKDLEAIPQAGAAQISDVVLQFPGVYQDSTSQGDFHVRNEHGNVQYRINGILLPDGVSGFSQILETSFISSMRLITGALPAQYGLHTAGVLDITAKSGAALAGGSYGIYGGSRQTVTPSFEYGGVTGQTDYFFTGRALVTGLGLEIPTPTLNGIHDQSVGGRFFGYTSTLLDPSTRVVTLTGFSETRYQIPNNVGQPINVGGFNGPGGGPFTAWGIGNFDSSAINQNQYERNAYGVMAWQRSAGDLDVQLASYTRYSDLHFVPDLVGDMLFNNVASDVFRSSFLNGISGDAAYRVNDFHTLRGGFFGHGEYTRIRTLQTVEALDPTDPTGLTALESPFNIPDYSNKLGWQYGFYLQDEWRLTPQLTFNYGTRFDQIYQYVNANQWSPRASLTWQPWWATVLHAGYARYFTPPLQVLGRTIQDQLYVGTTNAAAVPNMGSIQPERANVYDVGIVQQLLPQCPAGTAGLFGKAPLATTNCPSLSIGATAYYKESRDLIDDGQFGQAYVLTAFNYAKAENWGFEFTGRLRVGNFSFDTSWAISQQLAMQVASNQALFTPDDIAYIATHWIHTDHDQRITGSARAAYRWQGTHSWMDGTTMSATMIYGSGLRQGFVNTDHLPSYWQVNTGISREFAAIPGWSFNDNPVTVRLDVVNVTDNIYQIRSGSGIGVFAPQYGPRRGYYFGISQKLGEPGSAEAAPYYTKAPAIAAPIYNWTGPYVGGHFGGACSYETITVGPALLGTPVGLRTDPCGVLGGTQFGYHYQLMPSWMLGIEGEIGWTSAQGRAPLFNAITASAMQSDHRRYETLSGRLGYVFGPAVFYAKGGEAFMHADYRLEASSGAGGVNGEAGIHSVRYGWTLGAGLEYLFSREWSAKAEYSFLNFGSDTIGVGTLVPGNFLSVNTQVHEVKAGVNYHLPGTLF